MLSLIHIFGTIHATSKISHRGKATETPFEFTIVFPLCRCDQRNPCCPQPCWLRSIAVRLAQGCAMLAPVQPGLYGASGDEFPESMWGDPSAGAMVTWRESISEGTILSHVRDELQETYKCRCKTFDRRRGNRGRELQITGREGFIEAAKAEAHIIDKWVHCFVLSSKVHHSYCT